MADGLGDTLVVARTRVLGRAGAGVTAGRAGALVTEVAAGQITAAACFTA